MAKYKVGDKVRVRQWDDMAKEYGVNYSGDILSHGMFTSEMRKYCGKNVNISYIGKRGYYMIKEDNGNWDWSDDMFETIFKSESEYTGIELLQAIKDGVFKTGSKFVVKETGYVAEITNLSCLIRYVDTTGFVTISEILYYTFVPIKPIKPIKPKTNLAKENEDYNAMLYYTLPGTSLVIPTRIRIKENTVAITLNFYRRDTDGNVTGVAKCCPEDKFDKEKGIEIAKLRALRKLINNDIDERLEKLTK